MRCPALVRHRMEWERDREARERLLARVAAPVRDRWYRNAVFFKSIPQSVAAEFSTEEQVMPEGATDG